MPPRKDQTKSVKDVKKTAAKVIEKKAAADPKDKKVRKTASKVAAAPAEQKAPIKEKTPAKATVTKKKIAPAPAAAKPVRATKPATATAKKSQSVPKKEKESNESDKENELTSSKSSSSGKRKREETVEAPEKEKEQEKVAEEAAQVQPKKKVRTVAPTAATRAAINKAPTKVLEVFVFGEGTSGELGLGTVKTDGKKPIDVKRPRLHPGLNNIVQLSCGGMHSIALTANNEILTWGVNDQGALGRDTTWAGGLKDMDDEDSDDEDSDDVGLNPKESTPGKAVLPEGITWVQVAASDSASFALTDAGHVWGWGTFRSNDGILGFKKGRADLVVTQPIWIDDLKKIVEITTGSNHVLARDDKGKVYAWGSGQQCQLGRKPLERDVQSSLIPAGIGSLSAKLSNGRTHKGKPVKLACGSYHSFVIDDKHKVWAWGLNNYAELGLPDEAGSDGGNVLKPTLVESLEDYDIVQVAGGEHHSLACTIDGKLLTWGRIDGNQVGLTPETFTKDNTIFDEHNKPRILKKPTVVPNLPFISFVAAGTDHSLAVSDEGRVYSWGFSANYQTGQGTTDDIKIPTLIDNTAIREKKITWAGAGGQFSILASVKDGQA